MFGITIDLRLLHFSKQDLSIDVTLFGILIEVKLEQI